MSSADIPVRAEIESSVSPALTTMTRPSTGGIWSFWPMWSWSFAARLLAHHRVIIEIPNLWAIPVSVSPDLTV